MKRTTWLVGLLALYFAPPAHAHVGNKDVFEQINAGPYTLYVTIRTPTVIPGVATLEVRSSSKSGATVQSIRITPLPLTGEASLHPPTARPNARLSRRSRILHGLALAHGLGILAGSS